MPLNWAYDRDLPSRGMSEVAMPNGITVAFQTRPLQLSRPFGARTMPESSRGKNKTMTEEPSQLAALSELRRLAEEKVRANEAQPPKTLSSEEAGRLIHELQVHQIELQMQNEELRRAQNELEASRARYFDLYDRAPVGYFALSEQGLIREANLTGAGLLGWGRRDLTRQPISHYILPEDQDIYYRHRRQLLKTGTPQKCELRMLRADAAPFSAQLESTVAQDGESGDSVCRVVVSDIDAQASGGAVGRPEPPQG